VALKGIKTIQQIAKEFDIHPVQVSVNVLKSTPYPNPLGLPHWAPCPVPTPALRSL
jgi:hypothetical protein